MSSSEDHSTSHIVQSLITNLAIAAGKGVVAFLTGSGALLAETLHSTADCGNQLLLLLGVNRARKKPDASHPLGYGRSLYFWSFLVALLLFSGGGVFSIYEGIHKLGHPEPVEKVHLGLGILGFSLLLEGNATISNIREMNKRRGQKPFFQYLKDTKDSDLVVVFGENAAASLGLILASIALAAAYLTGDPKWDAIGSIGIGVVLVAVAVFLAVEIMSLLIGESADPEVEVAVRQVVAAHPKIDRVLHVITVQQGPGEVLVCVKVSFYDGVTTNEVCTAINEFEASLRHRRSDVRWCFVEPDIPRSAQVA
ncbi:cation diffusion facilitator family transporter [Polyangium sp. 6x1]|uniref:cation diffusion facilitator family transporter n=1 Tax=Polyangium sp. 6x1 TaxID=3042689 RepID=UPI002482870E|nr:cation diffusion facilitator family transporter [Polyangium sp. 6x1]MDI1443690.1 cation diffusion facilitator family transporter [Polyangium sp. 6x1]